MDYTMWWGVRSVLPMTEIQLSDLPPLPSVAGGGALLGNIARFVAKSPISVQKFTLQAGARSLLPKERVAICCRWVIPGETAVKVLHNPEHEKAFYGSLQVCGSVWLCPVCAAKITEKRRLELRQLVDSDYGLVMATYTLRHKHGDRLKTLLDALLESYQWIQQSRSWRVMKANTGLLGMVKALEVTYGLNGWHPHLHILMVFPKPLVKSEFEGLESFLRERWLYSLDRRRLDATWENGVTLTDDNEYITDYVSKFGELPHWTFPEELTKHPVKKSKGRGGQTPTGLLMLYTINNDSRAGKLWVEYARAFKGKRQLRWSPGLRKLLGLDEWEKSDEELAEEAEEAARLLALIDLSTWRKVLGHDARGELLDAASSGDGQKVLDLLAEYGIETEGDKGWNVKIFD